ncbi:MAG TPA: hypothetical protein VEL52_05790 [Candidatus Bathyarchaeia archaeon]|nr:hypothetical protein [Candidatus Bathyarchaeia archaeon]
MGLLRRIDFLALLGAVVALFLGPASGPWWTVTGATTSRLLTVQVSPFSLQADATGLSASTFFSVTLGSFTSLLLILSLIALGASSLHPGTWWSKLTLYFSLCSMTELYLSFLLMYHSALTMLLGAYGILPPYLGTSQLLANIVGLDLNSHRNPLVTASFSLPFYLGFLSIGLITTSLIVNDIVERRKTREMRGVGAIFTNNSSL